MAESARRNHFIPQFFLAGFTQSGSREDCLWVLDKQTGRQWKTGLANIAVQKDFYRIDIPETEPDAIEKALGQVEGRMAGVLKELPTRDDPPEGHDLVVLVNLVAQIAVRVPRIRNIISNFTERVIKDLNRLMVAKPERWNAIMKKMAKDGVELPSGPTYSEMKSFVESGQYSIDMGQNWHMGNLLSMVDALIPVLTKRKWSLIVALPDADDFICSDSPVALSWAEASPGPLPPGFAMARTELTMPLNRRMAVLARFEDEAETLPADNKIVASINSRTGHFAERYIYSPKRDFTWLMSNGAIGRASDLLAEIAKKKEP